MRASIRSGSMAAALWLLAACGGEATLQALEVTPGVLQVTEHLAQSVSATAVWDDGTRRDVTAEATWSSSDPAVAAARSGMVQAAAPGAAVVTARWSGLEATAQVEVLEARLLSLELRIEGAGPGAPTLAAGLTAHVIALGTYSDGQVRDVTALVTWGDDHDDDDPVEVDEEGTLLAAVPAELTLSASLDDVSAGLALTVTPAEARSLALTGLEDPVPVGEEVHLHVLAWLTDGRSIDVTGEARLEVVDPTIAGLEEDEAELEALRVGTTEVRASYGGLETSATLRVSDAVLQAIEILPLGATFRAESVVYFRADGRYSDGSARDLTGEVDWGSSNPSAAFSYDWLPDGNVYLRLPGVVTILASLEGSPVVGRLQLTVLPK